MSSVGGNISKPINIEQDIAYTLGLDTGCINYLCGDVDGDGVRLYAINPWSLIKPVRFPYNYHMTGWNASANNNYGIVPHCVDLNFTKLRSDSVEGKMNGWEYEPPRGTENNRKEYYRPDDFDGYNHNSPRPFDGWSYVSRIVRGGQFACGLDNVVSDWDYDSGQAVVPTSIYFGHILLTVGQVQKRLHDCYFGVAVFDSNNNCVAIATCDKAMGAQAGSYNIPDERWSVQLDNINWQNGSYTAYPFFWISDTSAPMPSNWLNNPYGALYTVPYTTPQTINVVQNASASLSGDCGIDPPEQGDPSTIIRIGYVLQVEVTYSTLVLSRLKMYLNDGQVVYDSRNDSQFVAPTMASPSGVTSFDLITALDESVIGIVPTCPVQYVATKLSSGNYTLYAEVYVTNEHGATTLFEWHKVVS